MTDDHRAQIIQGIRDLADWLDANSDIPVYAVEARYSVGGVIDDDVAGRAELDRIANAASARTISHNEYHGQPADPDETHFYVARSFAGATSYNLSGDVYYRASYILRQHMADTDVADKARAEVMKRLREAREGGAVELVEHPPADADFTTATLARCRWAQVHGMSPAWSHGEQVAVAVVLDDAAALAAMGLTLDAALHVLADRFGSNVEHAIAWVGAVRAGLRGGA